MTSTSSGPARIAAEVDAAAGAAGDELADRRALDAALDGLDELAAGRWRRCR
jgi:hypothetical protein